MQTDGIGDLQGILQKLDYIEEMGFTAIWLHPINATSLVRGRQDKQRALLLHYLVLFCSTQPLF